MKFNHYIRLTGWLTLFLVQLASVSYAEPLKASFVLLQNNDDTKQYSAKLILDHTETLSTDTQYQLAFNTMRPILSANGNAVVQLKQGGDFYLINFSVPKGSKKITFIVEGKGPIRNITDAPSGYFLVDTTNNQIQSVNSETVLPPAQSNANQNETKRNQQKENTSIEGNPIETTLTAETSLLVPLPAELTRHDNYFVMNPNTQIYYQNQLAKKAADFFVQAIQPATGFTISPKPYQSLMPLQNVILLTTEGVNFTDAKQKDEGYLLEVTPSRIIIRALSEQGFFYGLQSLRQLLPPNIFNHSLQSSIAWTIPSVTIRDYPRFEYRGLHLDSARHFIPGNEVKRLLDLMAIHKLNYFEWHLTDDEGWRIEIKQYPMLTQKGAWRGYDPTRYSEHDLLPAFGSGAKPYGGYYTQDDIRDIVQYAKARQITIIPEIDMPGHARAMIMSLPKELIDQEDLSSYTSIQGYHDNVLSPCKKETFTVIDNILTEVAALFPSKYIHIGGDEVPPGVWEKSCMSKKYDPRNPQFKDLVQNEFMKKVQTIINSKGKIMAGWEEIAGETSTLDAPLRVYIWNTMKIDQAYKKSARAGYEVIMAPAENLYFDLAYNADPNEPGQYWAGYVDTFSAYSLKPIDADRGQSDTVIKGVQGQLWSEVIDSSERLDYLAFPKVAGFAELAWTEASKRNWKNFSARMREKHLPRLKQYGVQYRSSEFQ